MRIKTFVPCGGANAVVFVPLAKVFVKGAKAVQFAAGHVVAYSGTGFHPLAPVEVTTIWSFTSIDTIRTTGGDGALMMFRVPTIEPWYSQIYTRLFGAFTGTVNVRGPFSVPLFTTPEL
jgi:hypothetical protein